MARAAAVFAVSLLLVMPAAGEENPLPEEQAAARARKAFADGDEDALRALARAPDPDPWLVVELLLLYGAPAAARAVADGGVEALAAYAAKPRPADGAAAARLLAVIRAVNADPARVLALTDGVAKRPDRVIDVRRSYARGWALLVQGKDFEGGLGLLERTAGAAVAIGWEDEALRALNLAGNGAFIQQDWRRAFTWLNRALALAERLGRRDRRAVLLQSVGLTQVRLGRAADAIESYEKALTTFVETGRKKLQAETLNNLGIAQAQVGRVDEAVASYKASLAIKRELQDARGIAGTLTNLGNLELYRGAYRDALAVYDEALALARRLKDPIAEARAQGNRAIVKQQLGEYAQAVELQRQALSIFRRQADRTGTASTLVNLGVLYRMLGRYEDALAAHEQALGVFETQGDEPGAARALANVGVAEMMLGRTEEALATQTRALGRAEAIGDRLLVATRWNDLGLLHRALGSTKAADEAFAKALGAYESLGAPAALSRTLVNIGHGHVRHARWPEARAAFERALRVVAMRPNAASAVSALAGLADVARRQGDARTALAHVQEASARGSRALRGLAEQEGARARDVWTGLLEIGANAALDADDAPGFVRLLETVRAGTLREALGTRTALRAAVVPEDLDRSLGAAQREEQRAVTAYGRAADLRGRRLAKQELAQARDRVQRALEAIRRRAGAAAALLVPEPDDLEAIQVRLAPGDALVLYAITDSASAAAVVQRDGVRLVRLPDPRAAVAAVLRDGEPYVEPAGLPALRRKVVQPLALPERVTRVLVSPAGALAYVPGALLFPDREVVHVPSGTTLGLLGASGTSGTGVLGVGDPDYSGLRRDRLPSLPGTRDEVEAVAEVKLLGKAATERGLREAAAKRARWRAIHIACHGRFDPERPLHSALALTPEPPDDGRLTCLEVFRMRLPADLVVLSACESGRGRVYRLEGLLGPARAFMYAGAARVLCSLWRVDDAATRALMTRFYELWNPAEGDGLGAAAALRRAQAHVRSQPKWSHPTYWAAWALWGLP